MCIEPKQDMFMVVLEIHREELCKMENMLYVLQRGKNKKIFSQKESFVELLKQIQLADSGLKLDWDDGAGEEWARFSNQKNGIVCMINAKIGIAFIRKNYDTQNINQIIDRLEVVYTEDYCSEEWYIDLIELKNIIPEIYWHASEGAVDVKSFSLDDFYYATI